MQDFVKDMKRDVLAKIEARGKCHSTAKPMW